MDLSKAFGCLQRDLIVDKLETMTFLSQHVNNWPLPYIVKYGDNYSDWSKIIKGVPQGSILGPQFS